MKPYQIKRIGSRTVEIISYPFEGKVNIRMVPMEPTTLKTVSMNQIQPHPFLSKCERAKFMHVAKVTGRGFFPTNMLKLEGGWFLEDEKSCSINPLEAKFQHPTEILVYKVDCDRKAVWYTDRWSNLDWVLMEIQSKLLEAV